MSLYLKSNDIAMLQSLNKFNPWWQSGGVPQVLVGKQRRIFPTLWQSLELRQMTILTGLWRVGKTTLMFQLVDKLLQKDNISPFNRTILD